MFVSLCQFFFFFFCKDPFFFFEDEILSFLCVSALWRDASLEFRYSRYNLIIEAEVRGHSWVPWGLLISKIGGKRLQVSIMDFFYLLCFEFLELSDALQCKET